MKREEYVQLDATDLSGLIRDGAITSSEAMEAAVAQAERMQPIINAVVHRFDPPTPSVGAEGVFAGVPFLLKDELDWQGRPMTMGSRALDGYLPEHTHPMIDRFLQAGLRPFGRTNMSEVGFLPTTEPLAHGPTRNPWNLELSAGGSSGGSAAAVASGIVPIAHAADGGGSIRIPASACGLVGLKPSRGRHPSWAQDPPVGIVSHHCVSRTVRDSAAFLDAMVGVHPGQRHPLGGQAGSFLAALDREERLRIALTLTDPWGGPIHPEVRAKLQTLAEMLQGLGHEVELTPAPVGAEQYARAFQTVWETGAAMFLKAVHAGALEKEGLPPALKGLLRSPRLFRRIAGMRQSDGLPLIEPFTLRLARNEARRRPSDLWQALQRLDEAGERLERFLGAYDLWMSPTLMRPPVPLGSLRLSGSDEDIERELLGYIGFTPLANATGLPAISLPAGLSREGAPIGAQFVAGMGREDRLLQVAREVEVGQPWPMLATRAGLGA